MKLFEVQLKDKGGWTTVYQNVAAEDREEAKKKAEEQFRRWELKAKEAKKI